MKHTIEVNGIKLYAYHGCLDEEAKIGGYYSIDVSITTDFTVSFASDDLNDTIDYVKINQIVKEEMKIRSKLIEHVGYRIYRRLKTELTEVFSCSIKIIKHNPP